MAPDLSAIADRVRGFTHASGVAIALTSNKSGEIECCARSGTTAPEIGRSVVAENSLTALAFAVESNSYVTTQNRTPASAVRLRSAWASAAW